jgi:uncharacterized protein (DUF488 family)
MRFHLVSIGYEGRTAPELVEELVAQGVDVLVDVRMTPLSRKPGLSKTKLSAALADRGIRYVHLPQLGNPPENREAFRQGRVADGLEVFGRLLQAPEPVSALDRVAELAREGVVAVLCFERDHARCHRQAVTQQVLARLPADSTDVVYV